MYKKVIVGFVLFCMLSLVLAACGIRDTATTITGPTVKMSATQFEVPQVTIKKGDTLTIIDDVAVQHIIKNGTWKGTTAVEAKEPGAPSVDLNFNGTQGEAQATPPFTTAGTFKLYCTIHGNMDLTVVVK